MCTLVGDPYPNEALLQPLVRHQCVSVGGEGEPVFFIKTAIERQHRTTVLSFHSMFSEFFCRCLSVSLSVCLSACLYFILKYSPAIARLHLP